MMLEMLTTEYMVRSTLKLFYIETEMVAALVITQVNYFPEIDFTQSISPNLICVSCKKLLRKPQQTSCGHRICKDCLEQLQDSSGAVKCPADGEELNSDDIFFDRFCERDVQNLDCYCYNRERGCKWIGQLLHFEEHASKCEYLLVVCHNTGCEEKLESKHLEDHMHNTCDFRKSTCENCDAQVIHNKKERHHAVCLKVDVPCTAGCGAVIARGDLEDHVKRHCVNAPIACPFEQSGCEFKGSRGDVQEHESIAVTQHIQMLGDQSTESSENLMKMEEKLKKIESEKENLETEMKESREAFSYTRQDIQTQQTKISIVEKMMAKQKEELMKLKETLDNIKHEAGSETMLESQMAEIISLVESQEQRLQDLTRDSIQGQGKFGMNTSYSTNSMTSERRLERNENVCALSEAKINQHDIRLQMLEATSYDGTYMWKIDDWNQRVRDARIGKTASIYSPPFYLGRYGYKVCGRLYPCGDGIGKDTHISLFFVVMKGEYDALLSWPFTQKVTFTLIDPNHARDVTDSFRPDPKSTSFQRPKSAMNIASGTPQFLSQKDLNNRGYVVEDTLYIKITVDRTGLREL